MTITNKNSYITALLPFIILGIFCAAFFLPILSKMIFTFKSDFIFHIRISKELLNSHSIDTPHFFYQLLTIFVDKIFFGLIDFNTAGLIAVLLSNYLLVIVVYYLLSETINIPQSIFRYIAAMTSVIVAPITILAYYDRHYYFGYIGINVFHNPTISVLKPFALLSFYYACKFKITDRNVNNNIAVIFCCLFTAISALTKPSYVICLLPALVLYIIYLTFTNANIDWKLVVWGIIIPSIILLAYQYYFTYSSYQTNKLYHEESKIIFAPVAVMKLSSSYLLPKYILSMLFPLTVFIVYFKDAIKSHCFILAWLLFLIGSFYTYFLAESGPRFGHMNFVWSGQITLFILFVSSIIFIFNHELSRKINIQSFLDKRLLLCVIIYISHLMSGIAFLVHEYNGPYAANW